jgi:glycosyltransferase involved in cell wall biosynthesis
MKKNICLFSLNYLTFGGGAEKYFSEVGQRLCLHGHKVRFLGDCKGMLSMFPVVGYLLGMVPRQRIFPSIKEIRLARSVNENLPFDVVQLSLFSLLPFSSQRRLVNDFLADCDAILVRNEIIDMVFLSLVAPRHFKKAIAIMFATFSYPKPRSIRARLHNFLYCSRFYSHLLRRCGAVVVSNHRDQVIASSQAGLQKQIYYVPYGLTEEYFSFGKELSKNSNFVMSYVGRFEEAKGVDYLPKLALRLASYSNFENITLLIAGSGPYEYIVRELTSQFSNIKYLGFLDAKEVRDLYDKSDVLVVPSRWETFSYVTLEAQSRGVLVVAFDVSGPNEIIVDGKSGIIVPPGRIDLLAESILHLCELKTTEPKKYWEMQKFSFEHAKTAFSLDGTVGRLEQIVDTVCKQE